MIAPDGMVPNRSIAVLKVPALIFLIMESDAKILIACSLVLAFAVIVEILHFSWFYMVPTCITGLLTIKHAKSFLDDHAVNHAAIAFSKGDDGKEYLDIVKQRHDYDFTRGDTEERRRQNSENKKIK